MTWEWRGREIVRGIGLDETAVAVAASPLFLVRACARAHSPPSCSYKFLTTRHEVEGGTLYLHIKEKLTAR